MHIALSLRLMAQEAPGHHAGEQEERIVLDVREQVGEDEDRASPASAGG